MTDPRNPWAPAPESTTPPAELTGYELHVEEPEEPTAAPERAPLTVRGTVVISARVVAGLVGVGVAAATLAAAALLPLPTFTAPPPAVDVVPVSGEQLRVCGGPLLRLGDESGQGANAASALGAPVVSRAASRGDVTNSPIDSTNEISGRSASVLSLAATGEGAQPFLAGSQWQQIASGDFVGAASAECIEPSDESWLVGGSTATGRTTLLSIVNPGEVVATVDISLYAESGEIAAPGASGIAVPPRTEQIYSLAGFGPDLASPVVRVVSAGGQVVATLQQSTVRTLQPGGIDYVSTSVSPTDSLVIPGIAIADHEALDAAVAGEDFLDLRPALRLFVPGEKQGHVTVTMSKAADATTVGAAVEAVDIDVTLQAGRVTELPLGDYESGTYTASITADVPVVAGVRIATVGTAGANDFAWLPAAAPLRGETLVAVANGTAPTLNLANPGDAEIDVVIKDRAGASTTVTVPASGAVVVPAAPGGVYSLSGFETLYATVSFAGDGTIAAHTVSPRGPTSAPITIYP
jgi:hypothetical protein